MKEMNEFMKVVLSLSLSGTLLLFVLLLFKKLYKKKFTKRFQYYIWLIVLVRFLFPFSLETTLTDTLLKMADTAVLTGGFLRITIKQRKKNSWTPFFCAGKNYGLEGRWRYMAIRSFIRLY